MSNTNTEQMIVTAPESSKLPWFLVPSQKYDAACASLATALIVEAEAKRQADMARHLHLTEALDCLEKQVFYPFQKLLDADECYFEDKGTRLLTEDESDEMDCFVDYAKKIILYRHFPASQAERSAKIGQLLRKYADAINEQRGMCDDPEDRNSHLWSHVWRHMIAANAPAVRTAD